MPANFREKGLIILKILRSKVLKYEVVLTYTYIHAASILHDGKKRLKTNNM